jgi:hypothetical protein
VSKPSTIAADHHAHLPDHMILIPVATQQPTSLTSLRKSSASSNPKTTTPLIAPHKHIKTIITITTITPPTKVQPQTKTTLPLLIHSHSPTPRPSSSTRLPAIRSKSSSSSSIVSAREERQETPINPVEINGERYDPETLDYDELYPSDFDYFSSENEKDDDFNNFSSAVRDNIPTPRSSIASVSDDDIEDLSVPLPMPNRKSTTTETLPSSATIKQIKATTESAAWYEKKPMDQWTQQDVVKFLREQNLNSI